MKKETGGKEAAGRQVEPIREGEAVLDSVTPGDILTWNEVSEVHRIRNGIYHRSGRLVSLLTDFGKINPCYPDFHGDSTDVIHYTGAGRRGDQKLDSYNRALLDAVESKHAVPLFNKLKVGQWEFLGYWRVTSGRYIFDESRERMVWKFTLEKV
jgi:hypothetical protein